MVVKKGYITWHAGAMNLQPEVASPELFDFSLRLSDDLDKHFNITRKTKVMSQRDVPGNCIFIFKMLRSLYKNL